VTRMVGLAMGSLRGWAVYMTIIMHWKHDAHHL